MRYLHTCIKVLHLLRAGYDCGNTHLGSCPVCKRDTIERCTLEVQYREKSWDGWCLAHGHYSAEIFATGQAHKFWPGTPGLWYLDKRPWTRTKRDRFDDRDRVWVRINAHDPATGRVRKTYTDPWGIQHIAGLWRMVSRWQVKYLATVKQVSVDSRSELAFTIAPNQQVIDVDGAPNTYSADSSGLELCRGQMRYTDEDIPF